MGERAGTGVGLEQLPKNLMGGGTHGTNPLSAHLCHCLCLWLYSLLLCLQFKHVAWCALAYLKKKNSLEMFSGILVGLKKKREEA